MLRISILSLIIIFLFTGCASKPRFVPVVELKWQPQDVKLIQHVVQRQETLYTVAFHYDVDYRQLAIFNDLRRPYLLHRGQILKIKLPSNKPKLRTIKPIYRHKLFNLRAKFSLKNNHNHKTKRLWLWPVSGRIITNYAPDQQQKGVDLAGHKGEKIHATANGVVAYVGHGLIGYGNLVIIKHDAIYLSAYGNNLRNLVKEGQKIKAGQVIAEIGSINKHGLLGVHFEIRKSGKPVNPLNYLWPAHRGFTL